MGIATDDFAIIPHFNLDKSTHWAGIDEAGIHEQEAILEIITSEETYLERLLLVKKVRQ